MVFSSNENLYSMAMMAAELSPQCLTDRQRDWIVKRDEYECLFPKKHKCIKEEVLHVHHINPQRFAKRNGIIDPHNNPNTLITLCASAHYEIHPDVPGALQNYRGNPEEFSAMFKERNRILAAGGRYWNDTWDDELLQIAISNTYKFNGLNGNSPYPENTGYTKRLRESKVLLGIVSGIFYPGYGVQLPLF